MQWTTSAVLLAALVGAAGCGGSHASGDSGTPGSGLVHTPAPFSGAYHFVSFGGHGNAPETVTARWGRLDADGVSVLTMGNSTRNVNGAVLPVPPGPSLPFVLSPSGDLDVLFNALHGGTDPAGDVVALAFLEGTMDSGHMVCLRQAAGLGAGVLSGDYHFTMLAYNGAHVSAVGRANFDGTGTVTGGTYFSNIDGSIFLGPPVPALPQGYAVAPDGELSLGSLAGAVLADGDLAVAGGGTSLGDSPGIFMYLREATSADFSTLQGTYLVVGTRSRTGSGPWFDLSGTLEADGAGNHTALLAYGSEGFYPSGGVMGTGSHIVAADGSLSLTLVDQSANQYRFLGAVSQDGSLAILGGMVDAGSPPAQMILIRR